MNSEQELRMYVIQRTILLEKIASLIMKEAWHLPNSEIATKTLGNKSDSLPFKTKINILFDFGAIDKPQYDDLVKLMEIRNQFAHSYEATSWVKLVEMKPEIGTYLLKEQSKETDNEKKYQTCYNKLFVKSNDILMELKDTYYNTNILIARDYARSIAYNNLSEAFNETLEEMKETVEVNQNEIPNNFFFIFKQLLEQKTYKIFNDEFKKLLTPEEMKKVFDRKKKSEIMFSSTIKVEENQLDNHSIQNLDDGQIFTMKSLLIFFWFLQLPFT